MSQNLFDGKTGRYRLSVICRNYETYEGAVSGDESSIIDTKADPKIHPFGLMFLGYADYSDEFKAMNTENDVSEFIKKHNEGF